eukprot:COSAG06_NODE_4252_length_4429_cov_5.719169_7_plen_129_part_00
MQQKTPLLPAVKQVKSSLTVAACAGAAGRAAVAAAREARLLPPALVRAAAHRHNAPLLLWGLALPLSVGRCRVVRSADFGSAEARAGEQAGAMSNSVERFVGKDDGSFEDVIDTSHNAPGNPWDSARL